MKFFAVLVCAHILGDFLLQPDCMAKHKNNNWVFMLHLLIHGLVGWLCIAQWNIWVVPLYIFAVHGLLDWVKRRMPDSAQSFIVDQCLHLLTLFFMGYYLNSSGLLPLSGISYKVLVWIAGFVATVQGSGYALDVNTPVRDTLSHLNLLVEDQPSKGAVLLFGKDPIRHMSSADINCLHFHGTEVSKPIPSQQVYSGTLFEMVDAAVDFVMSRLIRTVVPSVKKVASDVQYEIPYKAVREAIVNAIAHRSYASKAGVQVMMFADRLEVWNPGSLPEGLTVGQLRVPHHSVPRNRLLCEPLFLAHYIERAGTGTIDMIRLCAEAGLPEPQFRSEGEHFVTTIWRGWLTDKVLGDLGLNERQMRAVQYVRQANRITNKELRELTGSVVRTASRDLDDLVKKGVLRKVGETGRNTHYILELNRT